MSPRNKRNRKVGSPPQFKGFKPVGLPYNNTKKITLLIEEYEALRLADYSGLKQEDAAEIMRVSRPTFTRIYSSCLKKIAIAFAEGRTILIDGGNVVYDKEWYRCNDCSSVYHDPGGQEEQGDKCYTCDSDNIEHVNQSVKNREEKQVKTKPLNDVVKFCICPNCKTETPHQQGVPCFSLTCLECKTPLLRKGI